MADHERPAAHSSSSLRGPELDDRWYVVVIRDPDGKLSGLSRPIPGPDGEPFAGPWGALTSEEATALAGAWNADPAEGGTAEAVELYRYDKDLGWPDKDAGPAVTTDGRWAL